MSIVKGFGPMGLWASSFSSKVISDKTVAMNAAIDELMEAAALLETAATGKEKASGLFSFLGGGKEMDPNQRKALAAAAYKKGTVAFNKCAPPAAAIPALGRPRRARQSGLGLREQPR